MFNPIIREFVDVVHEAGGLCVCDMADYNGLFGLVRAKELGADMCHFNLHKAFASPHACMGPGCAAQCVSAELEKYLPRPRVRFDGTRYYTDYDDESSVGKIRQFQGSLAAVLRAYSWVMSLGVDGLKAVAETAILNNNYMMKRVLNEVRGISMSWAEEAPNRLEQVRYSFETLLQETGVDAEHVNRHMLDFGFQRFFPSHHPLIVPEPYTPEPTESYSKADIDEYVAALKKISDEAYSTPEVVLTAPHNGPISALENDHIETVDQLAVTWRIRQKNLHSFETATGSNEVVVDKNEVTGAIDSGRFLNAALCLALAIGAGTVVSAWLNKVFTFPIYIGAMLVAAFIRNTTDMAGKEIPMEEISTIGSFSLSLFLGLAMMGLKLWELADLAVPMVVMLVAQTVLMMVYAYFVVFNLLGKNYDAAVMTSGFCGFGMGATPNAMANMQAITQKYGPAPTAYFVVPLVGSLFIDFMNTIIITSFLNLL